MAKIEIPEGRIHGTLGDVFHGNFPVCSGCGTEFHPSRFPALYARGVPFGEEYRKYGTCAKEVAVFYAQHAACPDPQLETLPSGMVCVDRRHR